MHVLSSALVRGELLSLLSGRFTPGEMPPYPLDSRLGGLRNSRDYAVEKNLARTGDRTLTPRTSSLWPVAIPTAGRQE
jgi:hypothetical protein